MATERTLDLQYFMDISNRMRRIMAHEIWMSLPWEVSREVMKAKEECQERIDAHAKNTSEER
jgi:hypothetical protein